MKADAEKLTSSENEQSRILQAWPKTAGGAAYLLALLMVDVQLSSIGVRYFSVELTKYPVLMLTIVVPLTYWSSKREDRIGVELDTASADVSALKQIVADYIGPPVFIWFIAATFWWLNDVSAEVGDFLVTAVLSMLTWGFPVVRSALSRHRLAG